MKYIRPENRKYFQRQRELTLDNKIFIAYDRKDKHSFKQKVQDYMSMIDREESSFTLRHSELSHEEL